MEKYKILNKVGKCRTCTFYKGQAIANRQAVILKKLHKSTNWEQLLKSKQIALFKNTKLKLFPHIHEIVKDDDRFYIVMENMEENLETVIKNDLSLDDILKIIRLLLQMLVSLKEHSIVPKQLRPSYFFLNSSRNTLKIAELQTSKPKDLSKLDLGQLQDIKYLSPEEVLTANQPDHSSTVFSVGLIIYELISGKSLLNANTKINYIYQLCRLFPSQQINIDQEQPPENNNTNNSAKTFENIMQEESVTNQMVALLSQMLRVNKNDRITIDTLLESFDLIADNQLDFEKHKLKNQEQSKMVNKPNTKQVDINNSIFKDIHFDFQTKSTLSAQPILKDYSHVLASQENVDDDAVQPIIIKQSSKPQQVFSKQSAKQTRSTNNPALNTIRRPQLTNYAMNQANLGVQIGINPTLFSDNDF